MMYREFTELIGKTLTKVEVERNEDVLVFEVDDGVRYKLFHDQDCCESVGINDICGNIEDLIGSPIILAVESSSDEKDSDEYKIVQVQAALDRTEVEDQDSFTWTFYRIATIKGTVVIRWYGSSNGYYSESVNFAKEGEEYY